MGHSRFLQCWCCIDHKTGWQWTCKTAQWDKMSRPGNHHDRRDQAKRCCIQKKQRMWWAVSRMASVVRRESGKAGDGGARIWRNNRLSAAWRQWCRWPCPTLYVDWGPFVRLLRWPSRGPGAGAGLLGVGVNANRHSYLAARTCVVAPLLCFGNASALLAPSQ